MRHFEFVQSVIDENNARAERTHAERFGARREYPEVDASEALADIAAELDAILAGYGYGKAKRLVIVDGRGMGLECLDE